MAAMSSAVTVFFIGHRITPLLRPWSTMTKRSSKPLDRGSPVISLEDICLNRRVCSEGMGFRGGRGVCLFCFVDKWSSLLRTFGCIGPFLATSILQRRVGGFLGNQGVPLSGDRGVI